MNKQNMLCYVLECKCFCARKVNSLVLHWDLVSMSSVKRTDSGVSEKTMMSRAWSTTDLSKGIEHVLLDGKNELPNDMAQLEARLISCSLRDYITIVFVLFHMLVELFGYHFTI